MKWIKPSVGDLRQKEGFLFFPKGSILIRWWEYAKWTESYDSRVGWAFCWWNDGDEDEDE